MISLKGRKVVNLSQKLVAHVTRIDGTVEVGTTDAYDFPFYRIRLLTMGAVVASMVAYLAAQLCDVFLFHFWKRLTRGRHLWLRNNGSTMVSQLVDTVCVVLVTFWGAIAAGQVAGSQVLAWIGGGYAFKLVVALLDTLPFYLGVSALSRYLRIDPTREHRADAEGVAL